MLIKTTGPDLLEAIRILQRLAPSTEGLITVQAEGDTVLLYSFSDLNTARVHLTGSVEGSGDFGIAADALKDAIKGHNDLELSIKNSILAVKAKSYSAKLATIDSHIPDFASNKSGTPIKLDAETVGNMRAGVQAVQMKESSLLAQIIPIGIKLTEKGGHFACFDNQRMNYVRLKELRGDLEFTLPLPTVQALLDTVGSGSFSLRVLSSHVEVKSPLVRANLALPAEDPNAISFTTVLEKARVLAKMSSDTIKMNREKLTRFLANCRAVALKERSEIVVKIEDKRATLTVTTYSGTITTTFKVDAADTAFNVDYEFFCSLFEGVKSDELEFMVESDAFLMARNADTVRVVSLNNEGDDDAAEE